MKYLNELNSFHEWLQYNPDVSYSARLLWYALMHYNNKCGWKQEFNVATSSLELDTGLSKQSIIRARNVLKQYGRIDFKTRSGRQSTIYEIIPFEFHTGTQGDTQEYTQSDTQEYTQSDTQEYTQGDTQSNTQGDTIHRLDKTRLLSTNTNVLVEGESPPAKEKKKATRKVFVKPTPTEIQSYVDEHNLQIDPERFFDYYEGNGWKVGKNPMKDWKATARNWSRRNEENGGEYNKRTRVTTTNEPKTDEYADLYL